MDVEDVSRNINRRVHYSSPRLFLNADYVLSAYIVRKVDGKIFRQAELKDLHNQHSVLIVPLADVTEVYRG